MKPSYIKHSILTTIRSMSNSPEPFVKNPGVDFTRNRKCSFSSLLLCVLSMESHSLNREIRRFFAAAGLPLISKSAFIQQRNKLNEQAFPFLFSAVNDIAPFKKKWHGYHLLAVDGSDVNIPPLKDDPDTYVPSNTPNTGYHQMHLNAVYDLLEERYVDILIQPRARFDERDAFLTFIKRDPLPGKCIYIADRGYYSNNVLANLYASKNSFVLRIKDPHAPNSFTQHFCLPDSDEFDITLDFFFTRSRKKAYRQNPDRFIHVRKDRRFDMIPVEDRDSTYPVSVRLVKLSLPDGSHEYLVTDLPKRQFESDKLRDLYDMRWGIETAFRYLKYNVALNYFHSLRRDFIVQEIYARVILYNLTMLLVNCVSPPQRKTRYQRKVSISDAVITCRDFLIYRFKNEEIVSLLLRYLTDIRPGRSFPRKSRSRRFISLSNRV